MNQFIKFFKDITLKDIPEVGGKNASLGEMYRHLAPKGINLPNGFATTSDGYHYFLKKTNIRDEIAKHLENLDVNNMHDLNKRGKAIRTLITNAELPSNFEEEIRTAYDKLSQECGQDELIVAVRSSATAEDLPDASFAGQQETFLNIKGANSVIHAVKECIASLFTDRAIAYRVEGGFDHMQVALSVGVQQMVAVRSEASGVLFTIDTESGFKNAVVVTSVYGIGENLVQGRVSPDEFTVFKPTMAIIRHKLG